MLMLIFVLVIAQADSQILNLPKSEQQKHHHGQVKCISINLTTHDKSSAMNVIALMSPPSDIQHLPYRHLSDLKRIGLLSICSCTSNKPAMVSRSVYVIFTLFLLVATGSNLNMSSQPSASPCLLRRHCMAISSFARGL